MLKPVAQIQLIAEVFMPTDDMYYVWNIELRERIARVEGQIAASEKALELARSSLSRNSVITVVTVVIAIVSIVVSFLHK